jgi:hypothetical protein
MAITEYEQLKAEDLPKGYWEDLDNRFTYEIEPPHSTEESVTELYHILHTSDRGIRVRFESLGNEDDLIEKEQFISLMKGTLKGLEVKSNWVLNETENGVVGFDVYLRLKR